MNEQKKLLVFMAYHEIPNHKQEQILQQINQPSIEKVLTSTFARKLFSAEETRKLLSFDVREFEASLANMQARGIEILTIFDDQFPKSLISLVDRPLILFCKGNLSLLKEKCFAIVGTRAPTAYGRLNTERFAKTLAEAGLVIVSGLCYGVDAIAHRATLDAKGKTIAIIGGGFNHIYPSTNTNLAKEIVESGGLVLSEYPPSFVPKKYTFPKRNRIVAGLCDGILITEAGLKSGTLHTKEFALEYLKDIFVVPGSIQSEKSALPNLLLKLSQGTCVTCPEDILQHYSLQAKPKEKVFVSLTFEEQAVVNLLQNGQQNFEFLAEKSKIPVNLLSSCLTTLEIRGLIRRLPAGVYGLV